MPYKICKLRFSTLVRFGSAEGGDSYTGLSMTAHADTLFSALYISLLPTGKAEAFRELVEKGQLLFSDTLPFDRNALYIPRPMGIVATEKKALDPAQRKLFKKLNYIPFEALPLIYNGSANPVALKGEFGIPCNSQRVDLRNFEESRPYNVTGFRFLEGCGLYTIIKAVNDDALMLFTQAMSILSADGFGGRVSSGWGKFSFTLEALSEEMEVALNDQKKHRQLLLSCALPNEEEADKALQDARYMLIRRGGFNSGATSAVYKRKTVYMFSAGSVFSTRFEGTFVDTANGAAHPVWRYAKGMFMGVDA